MCFFLHKIFLLPHKPHKAHNKTTHITQQHHMTHQGTSSQGHTDKTSVLSHTVPYNWGVLVHRAANCTCRPTLSCQHLIQGNQTLGGVASTRPPHTARTLGTLSREHCSLGHGKTIRPCDGIAWIVLHTLPRKTHSAGLSCTAALEPFDSVVVCPRLSAAAHTPSCCSASSIRA